MIDNFTIPHFLDQWDLCRGTEDHCWGTEAEWYLHLSGHAPGVTQKVENVKYSMIFLPGCPKQCCNLWWDPLLAVWQDDQTWALLPLAHEGHLRWHQSWSCWMMAVMLMLLLTSGFSTWACGYFSQQISNSFQQLYTRHMAEFGNVWREIATRWVIVIFANQKYWW